MADLASTRVFGKLTVMHEAIVKANAEIVGNVTANKFIGDGSQLTDLPWSELTGVPSTFDPSSHTHPWGEVTGAPATATRWPSWGEVTGKPSTFNPSAHDHPWGEVTGKPATATRWPSWGEVTGKPNTFSPRSHGHAASEITGLSDAATTSVSTIRSGTTKGNVGLGSVRNVSSYSQGEANGRFVKLTDQSTNVEYSGDGGMIVRTDDNNGSFIFQARSSGQAERFTVKHGATELVGDEAGWRIGTDDVWHDGNAPATATRWPAWGEVTGKPSTFTPESHTHDGRYYTQSEVDNIIDNIQGVPSGVITMWSGSTTSVPSGWALCDGNNGTPDLRNRFIVGAGNSYSVGDTGGASSVTLTKAQMPAHNHSASTGSAGGHSHTGSAKSAGSHSHSGSANRAGAHSHTFNYKVKSSSSRQLPAMSTGDTSSRLTLGGAISSAGAHTHSLSINSSGSHTHSLSINSNGAHTHSVSVGNAGSGQSHENRPPYYALAYIMKL